MLLEPSQSESLVCDGSFPWFPFYRLANKDCLDVLFCSPGSLTWFWVVSFHLFPDLSPAFGIPIDQFSGRSVPYGNLVPRSTNQTVLLFFWFSGLYSGFLVCQQHE